MATGKRKKRRKKNNRKQALSTLIFTVLIAVIVALGITAINKNKKSDVSPDTSASEVTQTQNDASQTATTDEQSTEEETDQNEVQTTSERETESESTSLNGKWETRDGNEYFIKNDGTTATGYADAGSEACIFDDSGKLMFKWKKDGEVVSGQELLDAAKEYGISLSSTAFSAMARMNTEYAPRLSFSSIEGTLLFMFEGAGANSDVSVRKNAMCVLVRNGNVLYINRYCSTIPDFPFDPSWNEGTPMPTLKSGIYPFSTVYHKSKTTQCAGLSVDGDQVVRHRSETDYYSSTSGAIHIHRRNRDFVPTSKDEQLSSQGCLLIGNSGKGANDEYATYSAILGITDKGDDGVASVKHYVNGKVIVDRYYARSYLKSLGYTDGAIDLIG